MTLQDIPRSVKNLHDELRRMESWYAKEYEYSNQSGYGSFSSAKGAYRWIRNYNAALFRIELSHISSGTAYITRAKSLVAATPWDDDYPNPTAVKAKVRNVVESAAERIAGEWPGSDSDESAEAKDRAMGYEAGMDEALFIAAADQIKVSQRQKDAEATDSRVKTPDPEVVRRIKEAYRKRLLQ